MDIQFRDTFLPKKKPAQCKSRGQIVENKILEYFENLLGQNDKVFQKRSQIYMEINKKLSEVLDSDDTKNILEGDGFGAKYYNLYDKYLTWYLSIIQVEDDIKYSSNQFEFILKTYKLYDSQIKQTRVIFEPLNKAYIIFNKKESLRQLFINIYQKSFMRDLEKAHWQFSYNLLLNMINVESLEELQQYFQIILWFNQYKKDQPIYNNETFQRTKQEIQQFTRTVLTYFNEKIDKIFTYIENENFDDQLNFLIRTTLQCHQVCFEVFRMKEFKTIQIPISSEIERVVEQSTLLSEEQYKILLFNQLMMYFIQAIVRFFKEQKNIEQLDNLFEGFFSNLKIVNNHETQILRSLFSIFIYNEDFQKYFSSPYKRITEKISDKILAQIANQRNFSIYDQSFREFCDFYIDQPIHYYFKDSFALKQSLREGLELSFSKINNSFKLIKFLNQMIDECIRLEADQKYLNALSAYFSFVLNKEEFLMIFCYYLTPRMVSCRQKDLKKEIDLANNLQNICHSEKALSPLKIIQGMMNQSEIDFFLAYQQEDDENRNSIRDIFEIKLIQKILIPQFKEYPVECIKCPIYTKYTQKFVSEYKNIITVFKDIQWSQTLSQVIVQFKSDKQSYYQCQLSLYSYDILLLFNYDNIPKTFEEIQSRINLPKQYLKLLLNQLVDNKLLVNTNTSYQFNDNFSISQDRIIKLDPLYLQEEDIKEEEENPIQCDLIIEAAIMKLLKINYENSTSYDQIIVYLQNRFRAFKINNQKLKDIIGKLIRQFLIERDENDINNFKYLP